MKKLFILSGVPASGKSTWIKENNLQNWTISPDKLRLMYSGIEETIENDVLKSSISQINNKVVFETLFNILEKRMSQGETTFIDATNTTVKQIKEYQEIAKKYSYRVYIIKFGRELELSELLERDSKRGYKQVGIKVIEKQFNRLKEFDKHLSKRIKTLTPENALNELKWEVKDVTDNYDSIQVIGDVQSCGSALEAVISEFREDRLYVLLGDLFDRGIEHQKTLELALSLLKKENVVFIFGNHEKHIEDFISGNKVKSADFNQSTLPALLRAGYSKKDLKKIVNKSQPLYIVKYNGKMLYFSHSGFDYKQIPLDLNNLVLKPDSLFSKGLGGYALDIDTRWDNSGTEIYQFHGHRNSHLIPVLREYQHQRSWNLEQKVEFGGVIGSVLIEKTDDGISISDVSVKNNVKDNKYSNYTEFSETFDFTNFKRHKYISSKEVGNGVEVLNFTNDAFFKRKWDDSTIKTRGLFINNANTVVARGYSKFFNLNELPETEEDFIAELIQGTKILEMEKANGFLGIISYIPELGGLRAFSKGAGEDYSKKAEELLKFVLNKNGFSLEDLEEKMKKDYNNKEHYSIIVEVIDPSWDPHIEKYKSKNIKVLDVVENRLKDNFLTDKKLELIKMFNFDTVKSQEVDFTKSNKEDIIKYFNNLSKVKDVEGFVLLLDQGQRIKIKTDWYRYNKMARNMIEHIIYKDLSDEQKVNALERKLNSISSQTPWSCEIKILIRKVISIINKGNIDSLFTKDKVFFIGNVK